MSAVLRELERLEQRVLGALRCVDLASGAGIEQALRITAPGARLVRNRGGLYVIAEWSGLAGHATAFDRPPDAPALNSQTLTLTVRDPAGRYLPRLVGMTLPRDPAPANAGNADSLFRPLEVPLFPSPVAPVLANWAVLHVSVTDTAAGDALGGALVRVISQGAVIARGLTDWRGEALVPVVGIPVTTWSTEPGAVIVSEISASVEAFFDPAAGTRTPYARVTAGRPPERLPLVNPASLEADSGTLPTASRPRNLAAGQPYTLSLGITLP